MDYNINQNNTFGPNNFNVNNYGKPPRKLNEESKNQLKQLLPKDKKVDITSVLGDGEAYQFAHELKQFLSSEGYDVDGVSQAVYGGPVRGQIIENSGEISKIIIGTQE